MGLYIYATVTLQRALQDIPLQAPAAHPVREIAHPDAVFLPAPAVVLAKLEDTAVHVLRAELVECPLVAAISYVLLRLARERAVRLLLACESRPAIPFRPLHCPWEQTFMSDDDPVRTWLEDLGDSGDPAEAIHLATSGSLAVMSQSSASCAV